MQRLIPLLLTIYSFNLYSQIPDWQTKENSIDSIHRVLAKNYINKKLGTEFVRKHLIYQTTYRWGQRAVTYLIKNSKCRHNIVPIVFNETPLNNIYIIDTNYIKIDRKHILNSLNKKCQNYFWIDSIEALKIAKSVIDFKNYSYTTQFIFKFSGDWKNLKTLPGWSFTITHYSDSNGYAGGESISIDPASEKSDVGEWTAIP